MGDVRGNFGLLIGGLVMLAGGAAGAGAGQVAPVAKASLAGAPAAAATPAKAPLAKAVLASNRPAPRWVWTEEGGEDMSCVMRSRINGSAIIQTVGLVSAFGRKSVMVELIGNAATPLPPEPQRFIAVYKIGATKPATVPAAGGYGKDGTLRLQLLFVGDNAARLVGGEDLVLAVRRGETLTIDTAAVSGLLDASDACQRREMIEAGGDPAMIARLAVPPEPTTGLAALFNSDDYPEFALTLTQSGITRYRVDADAAGKIIGCKIIKKSGNRALDDRTCMVLRTRLKLKPAIAIDGRPMAGIYTGQVRWIASSE